ncbi:MAG: ComEC/Rec2 family competence protein [Mycoplasma sp.]|nr:ComEC/Rec2 family competence protein [Candidatus Hennigella equi]
MFQSKYKQNDVLNNRLPLFGLLFLCGILYLGFVVNYWFLLFLLLFPFSFKWQKINQKQVVLLVGILVVFIILIIMANQFSLIDLIVSLLNRCGVGVIKKSAINYLDRIYDQEIADFIKLVLFNIKSNNTWFFYKQTVDLGIVWLICVSGFHISLLAKVIKKIFTRAPRIGKYVSIVVISLYSLLLDFSYASIRILLRLCLDWTFRKFNLQRYNRLGAIGLIICLLNPLCFTSYSFLLSFLVCSSSYFVIGLNFNNKIVTSIVINIMAFLVTIPFVIAMNHKISLLTFLNAFIFTYCSSFVFLYLLIFAWIPFMSIIHYGIMIASYVLIGNISFSNIFIYSNEWPIWIIFIYYALFFVVTKVVYLIVINNKI